MEGLSPFPKPKQEKTPTPDERFAQQRENLVKVLQGESVHGSGYTPLTAEQIQEVDIALSDVNAQFDTLLAIGVPAGVLADLYDTMQLPTREERKAGLASFKEAFKEAEKAFYATPDTKAA